MAVSLSCKNIHLRRDLQSHKLLSLALVLTSLVPTFEFAPLVRHIVYCMHRRRSGWTSGGRMASAEGGSVPSRVEQPTKGSGEGRELPQRGPGQSPGRKRILAYFEGHRALIFVPI